MKNKIYTHENDKKIPKGIIIIENRYGLLWIYFWKGNWRMNGTNQEVKKSKRKDWFYKVYIPAVKFHIKEMKKESLPNI